MPQVNRPSSTTIPQAAGSTNSYTVRSGDTLAAIASRHGTTAAALVEANKARYPSLESNPGAIQVGWSLSLPTGSPKATSPAAANQGWRPRSNNDVLMVGMNEGVQYEATELRKRGVNVDVITDARENDKVSVNGRTYDLTTRDGAMGFALTLGLPAEQTQKVADVLRTTGDDARDEMAQIAQVWAQAERGEQIPARLLLSGHHVESAVWGDDNGRLEWTKLGELAEAMPKAARSIEDLHIAACFSGAQRQMEKYRAIFPNVKTIWAYDGSAPGSASGATAHQSRWERATQGTRADLDRKIAEHTRKGENVAVWTADHGFMDGKPPTPYANVREDYLVRQEIFTAHFSGQQAVTSSQDAQDGELREFYNYLQRLIQHPELPAAERPGLQAQRDTTIRLIFYGSHIAPKFAAQHQAAISAGFQAAGLEVPNFATLSRGEARAKIEQFNQAVGRMSNPPPAVTRLAPLLNDGLRDLKPGVIPETWV